MNFELTEQEKAFRKELCDVLKKEANENVVAETEAMQGLGPYGRELLHKLGAKRLLAPSWHEKYGGRGLSFMTQGIVSDEMRYYRGPWPIDGLVMGPTLLRFGSEAQKDKYLTGIARGEIEIALGYTEPQAGSDLASVELRAMEDKDGFVLNGQKMFNTEAHYSEYHWLLVRTDTTVERHKGMSLFIVDLRSPGITIRPLTTMAGLRTNEVFYDNVKVSRDCLVGEKNKGWDYAMSAIGAERTVWSGDVRKRFEEFVQYVLTEPRYSDDLNDNSWILDELADSYIRLHISRLLSCRAISLLDKKLPITYESSMTKLFVSENRREIMNKAMQILGHYGELARGSRWAPMDGAMEREYLDTCRQTIVAGSSEIQRLVIADRGLRMPRK